MWEEAVRDSFGVPDTIEVRGEIVIAFWKRGEARFPLT